MPAKEQVQDKPIKDLTHTEESLSNSTSHQGSPTGLIHKLYGAVLSRHVVQKGVKKIKAKYHGVLEEGLQQIHDIKRKGEEVYISTRERVKTWCYSITIYNHFIGLWLIKNLPHGSQKVVSFEDFLSSFQTLSKDITQESEDLARSFYKQAIELWEDLKEPQLEDIKQCCLTITARTVALEYKIDINGFPAALVDLFNSLDCKKTEIITNEAFYMQVRRRLQIKLADEGELHRATDNFYTFAKRFAFLEFPLTYANQDVLKVLVNFGFEKLDIVGEIVLTRIDRGLNAVIRKLGYVYEAKEDPVTVLDRFNIIIEKITLVTSRTYKRSKLAIQDTGVYQYLDKHVHFEDRFIDLARIADIIYVNATAGLASTINSMTLTYQKITNEYIFTLYNVSSGLVKKRFAGLMKRYSCLKDATLRLRDNLLEIKFSKETFDKLRGEAQEQIGLIYTEVRGMNYQKLKVYGNNAYKLAARTVKNKVKAITSCGKSDNSAAINEEVEESKGPEPQPMQQSKEESSRMQEEEPSKEQHVEESKKNQNTSEVSHQQEEPRQQSTEETSRMQEEEPPKEQQVEESKKYQNTSVVSHQQEEAQPKQSAEESPKKQVEQANQPAEESPKKTDEQPKQSVEEVPNKQVEEQSSPKKEEQQNQAVEESPKKEEDQNENKQKEHQNQENHENQGEVQNHEEHQN